MILQLLKGRGMISGLFEKKRDAIPPHSPLSSTGYNNKLIPFLWQLFVTANRMI
jgi:hypothetical protein